MATDPSGSDIQLEINSTNNSTSILTVNGRFLVCTASPNEIYISGCSTATGGNAILYFMTRTNYGSSTSTNIFNAGTYDSRTFNTNATRALLGSNTSGDIYNYATNLGTAFNGGGSDIYYIYAVNLDASFNWSNFVRCTFSNSVSGVSSYYFTVTWTNAIRAVTISGGSSSTDSIPANSSTNWDSAYGAVVLSSGDAGYALDFSLGGSAGEHNNIWYATPYTTNVSSTTNPFSAGASVGRTFGTSTNPARLEDSSSSATNEVTSIPTEGHANTYRLWGRIYPGSTNPNLTDGKYFDGYYYNGGLFTACHPDTGVTVPTSTINITSSATQADVTVSGISSNDQNGFQWRYNGAASGTYGAGSVTPTSSNLPITSNLPAEGASRVFGLFVKNFSTNSNSTALHSDWIDTGQTVTVSRQSTAPDAPALNPQSRTGLQTSEVTSASWTTQGVDSGVQVQWQATGQGSPQLSADGSSGWATSLSRELGQTGYIRMTAASTNSATLTSSVVFAQQTTIKDDYSVTTAAAGSGTGQASQDGGGAQSYGLEIYKSNSQNVIIDGSSRVGAVIGTTTLQFQDAQTGQSSSGQHAFTTIDCSDENVTAIFTSTQHFDPFYSVVQVTRRSSAQKGIIVKVPFQLQQYTTTTNPSQVTVTLIRH